MIAVNRTIYCQQKYHPIPAPHHHRQLFIYCLLRFPNVPDFLYVNIKCPLKLSLPNASIHNITLVAASESQSVQGPGHLHRSLSPPGLGTSRAGTKYDDISWAAPVTRNLWIIQMTLNDTHIHPFHILIPRPKTHPSISSFQDHKYLYKLQKEENKLQKCKSQWPMMDAT